jgi:hypothetical protein
MRETLNPTIAEIRSDEFREIMLQAPIYQGIRMPTEEELRSRDRLEITAETIRQAAPNYSRPEESPFLRTVNNPAGIWQEDAGVDAAMIRSTRFVAETLRLTRTPEEIQADDAHIERVEALEQRTATGEIVVDANSVPEEGQALVAAAEQRRWHKGHGSLSYHLVNGQWLPVRFPAFRDGETSNESVVQAVLRAFSVDREIGLNSASAVSQFSSGGQQGYITESMLYTISGAELRSEEFAAFLGKKSWRKSFYKMMLLDIMCGSRQGANPKTDNTRLLHAMGFRETGSSENQWYGANPEHMFKQTNNEGEIALFPYKLVEGDTDFDRPLGGIDGIPMQSPKNADSTKWTAPKFGLRGTDEENEEIDYSSEVQEFLEKALPKLTDDRKGFIRKAADEENDELWSKLAERLESTSVNDVRGRPSTEKYEELKNKVAGKMLDYFVPPEGRALLRSGVAMEGLDN